jgi:curved DNA-binding protein CbpA
MVLPAGINLTLAPRLTSFARTADLRALDLQPTDGFVLSRIDGQATGETIARTTGLDDEDVRESLAVLIQHRLVEMPATPNIAARTGSIMPHDLQAARVSVMPSSSISGSYVQVSPDRPSQRPRNPLSNAPPPPPPSQPSHQQQAQQARSLKPSTYSGLREQPPQRPNPPPSVAPPPPRYDTPTTVAQVNVPRAPPTPTPPPRSAPVVTRAAPSNPPPSGPLVMPGAAGGAGGAPTSTPYVSTDGIDLEPEFRARVEEVYATLDGLDYYTLLGIDRSADKKIIKRGYYELAANFHPDKYFRKNLGPYKAKMEAIFGRLTIAHDTLTSKADRAEYDAYLGIRETTREQEDRLAGAQEEIRRAEEDLQRSAQQSVAISVNPAAAPPQSPSSPPPSGRPLAPTSPARSFDAQAAREALARKLLGGAGAGRPSSMGLSAARPSSVPGATAGPGRPSQASIPAQMNPKDAVDALKRRYEATITDSRSAQVQKYKKNAEELIAKGDYAAGLNSLRVALSFDPDNAELYALTMQTQKQADEILSVNYEKQARYEEKADNWREAARSWAKVARARPNDANAHERAANALFRGGGNMREASELAKRAVTLEPQNPMHRATLASVYIAGGMMLNAKREIDAALVIAPTHPAVLHAARRLKEVG